MINGSIKLPIDIKLAFDRSDPRISVITPFNPELGYLVDFEDLDLGTRIAKVERITREWYSRGLEEVEFTKAPFRLSIKTEHNFRLTAKDKSRLTEETQGYLVKLRAFARFEKGGSFMAKPWSEVMALSGILWFEEFYPQETNPLPQENKRFSVINEGFSLYLPDDWEKIKQVQLAFVFEPEQPEDDALGSK